MTNADPSPPAQRGEMPQAEGGRPNADQVLRSSLLHLMRQRRRQLPHSRFARELAPPL